ncbi:Nn.00g053330.m01.CDS01 [Neocucurbitaria sp. VM-36]
MDSVTTPLCGINRLAPHVSYNSTTLTYFFRTVDAMSSYPNTLGLLVASELVNNEATLSATPVIKASVRDLKKYMRLKNEYTKQRVLRII